MTWGHFQGFAVAVAGYELVIPAIRLTRHAIQRRRRRNVNRDRLERFLNYVEGEE